MSAPTLTPAEQAEVDRFGLHDEDLIADLERCLEESPTCDVRRTGCAVEATTICRMRCCGDSGLACDQCLAAMRRQVLEMQGVATPVCGHCKHQFGDAARLEDIVTVVPL